jgi:phosphoribosylformylglycinamidine synthase
MSYGYDPYMLEKNQYVGGYYSVIEAVAKAVATGARYDRLRLTMQEYFERMGVEATKWQKPFKALLGATLAMNKFEIAAIGGKDSMSGTFNNINVPPSLVTFAVSTIDIRNVVTPEFKKPGSLVFMIDGERKNNLVNINELKDKYSSYLELAETKKIESAYAVENGGAAIAVFKMAIGNKIGFKFRENLSLDKFEKLYGSIVFEVSKETYEEDRELFDTKFTLIGETITGEKIVDGKLEMCLENMISKFEAPLNDIFKKAEPQRTEKDLKLEEIIKAKANDFKPVRTKSKNALPEGVKPKVFIPSFPGTNSEIDLARAFDEAGGDAKVVVFRNRNEDDIKESIQEFKEAIKESQIIAIPGGFSGGDEPEGSAKFICSAFKNPELSKAIMELLNERDGLMLGICNGFQALVKLGLIKYGEIRELSKEDPTITHNTIGKHLSKVVDIEVTSKKSIWLNDSEIGKTYKVPVSHGEGRFYGNDEEIMSLIENGQISTIYGAGSNLNGSIASIEGACSPDGRVYGKMGHAERTGENLFKNVYGEYDMKIFEAGVNYFKK